jgi:cell division protein FtsB
MSIPEPEIAKHQPATLTDRIAKLEAEVRKLKAGYKEVTDMLNATAKAIQDLRWRP